MNLYASTPHAVSSARTRRDVHRNVEALRHHADLEGAQLVEDASRLHHRFCAHYDLEVRAARDDHEIDRVHEVAHTRVGNQRRVDAESRQLVRNTNARGKVQQQVVPVSLEASRGNEHVETLVILAVGKELVNDAGNAVRENGLHMSEDDREHHSVANVQLPLVCNV